MVIIGAGRVGGALHAAALDNDMPCTLVSRTENWGAVENGVPGEPILVTTRNDDLDAVLARVPAHLHQDLVFIQNGALGPWLDAHGLTTGTRGLLFFAVPSRGAPIEPGPEPSPFTGPHALTVARWLTRVGVRAQVVEWPRFMAWELEKLVWNCAFGLMCTVHDCDVGTVCDAHADELKALVAELRVVGRAANNVDLPLDWLYDRLVAYSRTIPTNRASLKAWPWRNGWFVEKARLRRVDTPIHLDLLRRAGMGEKLSE